MGVTRSAPPASRLNAERPDASETCCSRMIRTSVAYPAGRGPQRRESVAVQDTTEVRGRRSPGAQPPPAASPESAGLAWTGFWRAGPTFGKVGICLSHSTRIRLAHMQGFHSLTAAWFARRFGSATEPQSRAWPEIRAGRDVLVSAPTGSGKTLAAFLICVDRLVARGVDTGTLDDQTEVVYVSPLKALSTDIHKNLESPLADLAALAAEQGTVSATHSGRRTDR